MQTLQQSENTLLSELLKGEKIPIPIHQRFIQNDNEPFFLVYIAFIGFRN